MTCLRTFNAGRSEGAAETSRSGPTAAEATSSAAVAAFRVDGARICQLSRDDMERRAAGIVVGGGGSRSRSRSSDKSSSTKSRSEKSSSASSSFGSLLHASLALLQSQAAVGAGTGSGIDVAALLTATLGTPSTSSASDISSELGAVGDAEKGTRPGTRNAAVKKASARSKPGGGGGGGGS